MADVRVGIERLRDGVALPRYALPGDTGMDVVTPVRLVCTDAHTLRWTWETVRQLQAVGGGANWECTVLRIPLGFRVQLPATWGMQLRPKSGRSLEGLYAALGTIDSPYRGELCAIVAAFNPLTIERGKGIAQLVLEPVHRVEWVEGLVDTATPRGSAGFGSTEEGRSLKSVDEHTGETPHGNQRR